MNLLSVAHQLAWTHYPTIWLCESCAILWLVVRTRRSAWVGAGVLLMLCGLMLNALATQANAGTMPVVGMPSTFHPASAMWQAATEETRLPFLGDQPWLCWFSVGDLCVIFGGLMIVTICAHGTLKVNSDLQGNENRSSSKVRTCMSNITAMRSTFRYARYRETR
jgi:hypothetical protein